MVLIVNCPTCSGPLFKGGQGARNQPADLEISMRCPHCRRQLAVRITYETVVYVDGVRIQALGKDPPRPAGGGPNVRTIS